MIRNNYLTNRDITEPTIFRSLRPLVYGRNFWRNLRMSEPARKRVKKSKAAVDVEPDVDDKKIGILTVDDFPLQIVNARLSCAKSVLGFKFNKKRVHVLTDTEAIPENKGVLYWMIRDQRVQDNWAMLYAQRLALKQKVPLHVAFCIPPKYQHQTIRHYQFMLDGLQEVATECTNLKICFHLLHGQPSQEISKFIKDLKIGGVVVDFIPLKEPTTWVNDLVADVGDEVPVCQVDAHNIVPCREASPKCEYGARTIRTKIHKVLSEYLTEFPPVIVHPHTAKAKPESIDWDTALDSVEVDRDAEEVKWAKPGSAAGIRELKNFIDKRLKLFNRDRNNPNKEALSNLSPWIRFGHISMQRCIIMVNGYKNKYKESVAAYVEEAIIRRELADNYCFYNENYDSIKGAYAWAQETLKVHTSDKREYIYSEDEFENAKTHDDLWNAAQLQVRKEGKMHGFLRMYWAKKILEWTPSPEEAFRIALYLNDKFNLDGTDPNGYVGVAWSVCGVHDQGWGERSLFGKIRFMNYKGCKRKFDVAAFVTKYGAVSHVKGQTKLTGEKKKKKKKKKKK